MLPPNMNTIGWKLHLLYDQKTVLCTDDKEDKGDEGSDEDIPILTKCEMLTCEAPLVLHYFGYDKVWDADPWGTGDKVWPDIFVFWQLTINYICKHDRKPHQIAKLKKMFGIKKRICKNNIKMPEICFYCKWLTETKYGKRYRDLEYKHPVISEFGKLTCPRILSCGKP